MIDPAERYLALLKKSLLNELHIENEARVFFLVDLLFSNSFISPDLPIGGLIKFFVDIEKTPYYQSVQSIKAVGGMIAINPHTRAPAPLMPLANYFLQAHSMIGRARMDHLHACMDTILREDIPGDFIETGVWRGGVPIFINGFLAAHNVQNRLVWLADSFEGLPKPSRSQDAELDYSKQEFPSLAVSVEDVQALLARYHLLNDQVRFLVGWFKDTLPKAPITKLALLRLDGDLYESTRDALLSLYDKLAPGGFLIVDDYHSFPGCKEAVDEFRVNHNINDTMTQVDYASVCWRKGVS